MFTHRLNLESSWPENLAPAFKRAPVIQTDGMIKLGRFPYLAVPPSGKVR
jgi:hypothetical protein